MYQSQKSELARYGNFNEVTVILFLIRTHIDNIYEIQFSLGVFNFLFLILGHVSYQTEKKSVNLYKEHDLIVKIGMNNIIYLIQIYISNKILELCHVKNA